MSDIGEKFKCAETIEVQGVRFSCLGVHGAKGRKHRTNVKDSTGTLLVFVEWNTGWRIKS